MLTYITALTVAVTAPAQDTIRLTFAEAMDRARAANPEFVQQTIQANNAEISMASARASRYYPRLDMHFTVPSYSSELVTVRREDGSEIFVPVEAARWRWGCPSRSHFPPAAGSRSTAT